MPERDAGQANPQMASGEFPRPQPLHLPRRREQFVERPLRLDAAITQHNDVIGPAQRRAAVGDGEDRGTVASQAFPKCRARGRRSRAPKAAPPSPRPAALVRSSNTRSSGSRMNMRGAAARWGPARRTAVSRVVRQPSPTRFPRPRYPARATARQMARCRRETKKSVPGKGPSAVADVIFLAGIEPSASWIPAGMPRPYSVVISHLTMFPASGVLNSPWHLRGCKQHVVHDPAPPQGAGAGRIGSKTGCPSQRISPRLRGSKPSSARSSVVLPEPTCPVITVNEPRRMRRLTSYTPRSVPWCR